MLPLQWPQDYEAQLPLIVYRGELPLIDIGRSETCWFDTREAFRLRDSVRSGCNVPRCGTSQYTPIQRPRYRRSKRIRNPKSAPSLTPSTRAVQSCDLGQSSSTISRHMAAPESDTKPQIVLFGDSLTEWSFYEEDHGTGWYLQRWYEGKVNIVNEGMFYQSA